ETINSLPDGTMALMISGEPGYPFAIERSTNFTTWQEITNVSNPTGLAGMIDHAATNQPGGLYRARDRKSTRLNSSHTKISSAADRQELHSLPTRRSFDLETINSLPDGTMALMISGEPGYPFAIERSTNFPTWQEITNVSNPTGLAGMIDHAATNQPVGFYRA